MVPWLYHTIAYIPLQVCACYLTIAPSFSALTVVLCHSSRIVFASSVDEQTRVDGTVNEFNDVKVTDR